MNSYVRYLFQLRLISKFHVWACNFSEQEHGCDRAVAEAKSLVVALASIQSMTSMSSGESFQSSSVSHSVSYVPLISPHSSSHSAAGSASGSIAGSYFCPGQSSNQDGGCDEGSGRNEEASGGFSFHPVNDFHVIWRAVPVFWLFWHLFWLVEEDAIQLKVVLSVVAEVKLHPLRLHTTYLELERVVSLLFEVHRVLSDLYFLFFVHVPVGNLDFCRITLRIIIC